MAGASNCCYDLNQFCETAKARFRSVFGESPSVCAFAPGRVNLIGEHVDYNDGFVMPMAIPLYTVAVAGRLPESNESCELFSDNIPEPFNRTSINIKNAIEPVTDAKFRWSNYIRGILALFPSKFPPFRMLITSTIPLGGGLSSSASLEMACLKILMALSPENRYISTKDQALLCQQAEHKFAGVPCGIMDQFIISHAQKGRALMLDCRSLEAEHLPLDDPNVVVLVTNSNVKHELVGSEYKSRRSDCHEAAKTLGKASLRDVEISQLLENEKKLSPVAFRRARHAVTEIQRTQEAADALRKKDYAKFGQLMNDSHKSLRDDFEVSCAELDQLVNIAQKSSGVFGSRMTGGGFGGCTVTLVKKENVDKLMETIQSEYKGNPSFFVCEAVGSSALRS